MFASWVELAGKRVRGTRRLAPSPARKVQAIITIQAITRAKSAARHVVALRARLAEDASRRRAEEAEAAREAAERQALGKRARPAARTSALCCGYKLLWPDKAESAVYEPASLGASASSDEPPELTLPPKRVLTTKGDTPLERASGALEALEAEIEPPPPDLGDEDIWPLQMIDLHDGEQLGALYDLLGGLPHLIQQYLDSFIFPQTMKYQRLKLAASGQELGGDFLFPLRLGFSGTPSNLLPVEFGSCMFEECVEAQIIDVLTSPKDDAKGDGAVELYCLRSEWTAESLLKDLASAEPPYHALIDTGALVTGYSNAGVARRLLELSEGTSVGIGRMEGVVFLDALDRQMIQLRAGMKVVPLSQSAVPMDRRFTFFDQVHTAGIDPCPSHAQLTFQPLSCTADLPAPLCPSHS